MPADPGLDPLCLLLAALALDAAVGDPDWLWRRLPHPVAIIGTVIGVLDHRLNRSTDSELQRRRMGIFVALLIGAGAGTIGWLLSCVLAYVPLGWFGEVVIIGVLLSQRSLYDHVAAVAQASREGGLVAARTAVSRIVGRDPEQLDEAAVSRAAIESLAENFSDGIVAPAFWYAIAGLPGILAYKAINTADSMIGHKTERHRNFGWASARIDDLVNLPASRLSALFLVLAALPRGSAANSCRSVWRDARQHRSPNAGWPEAAMAGALGIALAGPRVYGGKQVEDVWMNGGGRIQAEPSDIDYALRLFVGACLIQAGTIALFAIAT